MTSRGGCSTPTRPWKSRTWRRRPAIWPGQIDFETIGAAMKRSAARIVAHYSQPFSITLPNVATLYAVVKTLVQRAKCHLILSQPEKAWQELTLLHELRRMVESQGR